MNKFCNTRARDLTWGRSRRANRHCMSLHDGTTKFWRCHKSSEQESTRPETTEISFRRIQPTLHEHMSWVFLSLLKMSRIYSCTAVKATSLTRGRVGDLKVAWAGGGAKKECHSCSRIFLAGKSMTCGKKERGFFNELRNDQLLTKTEVFHFTKEKKLISLVMSTNNSGVDSTFSLKKNVKGNGRQQQWSKNYRTYRLRINQEGRKSHRVRAKIGR